MRDMAARRRAPLDEPSSAPLPAGREPEDDEVETPPRLQFTARNVLVLGGFLVASIAALYYLLPQLAGLDDTWHRIEDGSPYWMFLALVFTVGMFGGYVMMFRGVFVRAEGAGAPGSAGARATDHDGGPGVADLRGRRRRRPRC